jgi:pimeloyl-ACP methyl ester carboxylesterase
MVSSTVFKNEMRFLPPALGIGLLLILICLNTTGCALIKLKQEVREGKSSTIIVGRVSVSAQVDGPIIVAAYTKDGGEREVAHYTVLHDWGEYELMVTEGNYFVFAFIDENRNLICEAGEAAGQYGAPDGVAAPVGGVVSNIDIVIPSSPKPIDWPRGQRIAPDGPQAFYSRLAGEITDLADERFSEENGGLGFWEPMTFFKRFGGSIFFLEPYDPKKIPILFIHGAGGTPRGWKHFIDHIDRNRFQPWFFYYPTGTRIRSMSYLLSWKLGNLWVKYKFDTLYITAHSMGGLVARSYLIDFVGDSPIIKLFVSLATPWGGDKMAEYGVEQSPAVIPCWIDMQPQGDFIQGIYRNKLPEAVDFYLFFGHRGNRNPLRSNNDGTITLSSLLDRRPQAEAKMSYAFDDDHASILTSEEVLDQYNTIINTYYAQHRASGRSPGGYLKLNFAYDYASEYNRPWPILLLRAKDKKQKLMEIQLSPADDDKVLGPLPAGSYAASLIADGARSLEEQVSVTIESDHTHALNFTLVPDGMISGYAETAIKSENKGVGMPGWEYLPTDNQIVVQSVTLKGPGVARTLRPLADEALDRFDLVTSRTDFCFGGYLRFYGLPAGQYELTIQAEGHRPYVTTHKVTPGREGALGFYELMPEQVQVEPEQVQVEPD